MVLSKKIGLLAAPILFFFIVNFPLYSVSETANAVIAVAGCKLRYRTRADFTS